MSAPAQAAASSTGRAGPFDRVLVEIDETPESLVAAAQGRTLCGPHCELELLAVVDTTAVTQAGAAAPFAARGVTEATASALEHARTLLRPSTVRFVAGDARETLLAEARATHATLVAVEMHEHSRLTARVFGTVDASILREGVCNLLVSRPGWGPAKPRSVVVGTDGSGEARRAEEVARTLAERLGIELRLVVALGGKPVDPAVFSEAYADAVLDSRDAISALTAAGDKHDLVVVGSRGLHGLRALGSVAERTVYRAHCSVLVVRGASASE
jgi:nucleotide-binding universal stress UspA family protein